jgi:ABC-type dipeptide/oligopeptide/nickel transport system permease component
MTIAADKQANYAIREASNALKQGDKKRARYWAIKAAMLAPHLEMPWLLLASVVSPQASVDYLKRALEINPESEEARRGMRWAVKRLRTDDQDQEEQAPIRIVEEESKASEKGVFFRQVLLPRMGNALLILLVIAFMTILGLYLAARGKQGLPITFTDTIKASFNQLVEYLTHHPETYIWHKEVTPWFKLVSTFFFNSAGLLLLSLLVATSIGGALGIAAALLKRRNMAPIIIFTSILGISIPSFLVAMLLWIIDFKSYGWLGLSKAILPPTGYGWDLHLVMPALVLAARPLAQIMQVTYVSMSDILKQDFIRVEKAKGASQKRITWQHALRNILIPVLTTMGTSLRFSLASLPVVESFFLWPGIGMTILQAFELDMPFLITDLTVALGLFFLLVNLGLDFLYPIIDPRVKNEAQGGVEGRQPAWEHPIDTARIIYADTVEEIKAFFSQIRFKRAVQKTNTAVGFENLANTQPVHPLSIKSQRKNSEKVVGPFNNDRKIMVSSFFKNVPLMIGTVMALVLVFLMIFGEKMTTANPYETHGIMFLDGTLFAPPFEPMEQFPWGTDMAGRDIQALVLHGARQTISLAMMIMFARVILGSLLGVMAGWWQNSWLDRFINSLISIWAAFPDTIFAMILILAIGIQSGRSVFIIALCLVGWGEIAQYIRGMVIKQKPELYIESARSVGAHVGQALRRHILPHLLTSIVVLAVLEMGSVLMILAELGFLNIFLGGGYKVMIAETGMMQPVIYFFSDIPEWGALLANIRDWWRSYPWLAWYPGVMFFLCILTFNLWGEGLRRFITESKINLNRLVNKYTITGVIIIVIFMSWIFHSTSPVELYKHQAKEFVSANVVKDVENLTDKRFGGRLSGTTGAAFAAEYIAERMEEVGLLPGYTSTSYLMPYTAIYPKLTSLPTLSVAFDGDKFESMTYRNDYVELVQGHPCFGQTDPGLITGVVVGVNTNQDQLIADALWDGTLSDRVLLIRETDMDAFPIFGSGSYYRSKNLNVSGVLVVSDYPEYYQRKYLYSRDGSFDRIPVMWITSDLAERLLASANSSLEKMEEMAQHTAPDNISWTAAGCPVDMNIGGSDADEATTNYHVMGYIPGKGAQMGMNDQVIVVSANYDGVGIGPDGTFYPGANDNASGIGTMLELARVLNEGDYFPDKTVVFIAWSGGPYQEGLKVANTLNATKMGFGMMNLEAVMELSGTGGGTGDEILLYHGTSYRLTTLFEDAANRLGYTVTTRGQLPKYDDGRENRQALTGYIGWNGSSVYSRTPEDTANKLEQEKIQALGETTALALTIMTLEMDY